MRGAGVTPLPADGWGVLQHMLPDIGPVHDALMLLRDRATKLLNVVKIVPSAATCSKDDAVAWLLKNPSQLSAIAKAESCGQPASPADFNT